MRPLIAATALTVALAGCSASEDAGAPPPTAEESHAVEDARSMIPEAEKSAATMTPEEVNAIKENPDVNPTIKPGYETPVPGPERAE